jgi:hypothetical protein
VSKYPKGKTNIGQQEQPVDTYNRFFEGFSDSELEEVLSQEAVEATMKEQYEAATDAIEYDLTTLTEADGADPVEQEDDSDEEPLLTHRQLLERNEAALRYYERAHHIDVEENDVMAVVPNASPSTTVRTVVHQGDINQRILPFLTPIGEEEEVEEVKEKEGEEERDNFVTVVLRCPRCSHRIALGADVTF